jgi:hypothetical protein
VAVVVMVVTLVVLEVGVVVILLEEVTDRPIKVLLLVREVEQVVRRI